MLRFASLDPFLDPSDWQFRMGRPIANEGFLRALFTYGTFDEYRFYLPDLASVEAWRERVHAMLPDPALHRRLRPLSAIHLGRDLREAPPDVFHHGDFTYFQPQLSAIRSRLARTLFPITGITHSLDQPQMQTRFLQLTLCGSAPCDAVICTSEAARRLVENKLDEVHALLRETGTSLPRAPLRTSVIPLGLEETAYSPPIHSAPHRAARARARASFGITDATTLFLSVGRLSLRTKCDWAPALELIAEMKHRGEFDNSVLLIAGGGGDSLRLLEDLIHQLSLESCVVTFPNFPPELKPTLYAAADVYVSLVDNYQETFGISVVEAMAAGLPVIATDFDGYRDAVRNGENGWSIPTIGAIELPPFLNDAFGVLAPDMARLYAAQLVAFDPEALRVALREAQRPELRGLRAENARATAERYRWRTIIPAYEALWRDLSATARTTARPIANPALLAGNGMRAFQHYTTRTLRDHDRLAITPRGHALRSHPERAARYADVAAALHPEVESVLLQRLAEGVTTVADLRAGLTDADFTLHWLLKHGAAMLVPA